MDDNTEPTHSASEATSATDTDTENAHSAQDLVSQLARSTRITTIIAVLALIFASIALVQFGLGLIRGGALKQHQHSELSGLQAKLEQNQAALQQAQLKITALQKIQQQSQQILTVTRDGLAKIMAKRQNHQQAWLLDEASHLVRLAQYQLQYARDIDNAVLLLQSARQSIAHLTDPALLPVQQIIAKTIQELKGMTKVDVAAILTKLNALNLHITSLPLRAHVSLVSQKSSSAAKPDAKPTSHWRQAMSDSWATIKNLIVIRRTDTPIKPLLAPGQRMFLDQNIRLLLQEAQSAAMSARAKVYQASLTQAHELVSRYFAQNAAATQRFLKNLSQLKTLNVNPVLPNLKGLLSKLHQLSQTRAMPKSPTP